MPIIYSETARMARMEAVEELVEGGTLELCAADGTVLAQIGLPPEACRCEAGTLYCSPEVGTFAVAKGKAVAARIIGPTGEPVITGLTVGQTGADVTMDYVNLEPKQIITVEQMSFSHA